MPFSLDNLAIFQGYKSLMYEKATPSFKKAHHLVIILFATYGFLQRPKARGELIPIILNSSLMLGLHPKKSFAYHTATAFFNATRPIDILFRLLGKDSKLPVTLNLLLIVLFLKNAIDSSMSIMESPKKSTPENHVS